MSRILKHMLNHGVVAVEIPDILHVFTHANIIWFGRATIVVHAAVCTCTWDMIHTTGLKRVFIFIYIYTYIYINIYIYICINIYAYILEEFWWYNN